MRYQVSHLLLYIISNILNDDPQAAQGEQEPPQILDTARCWALPPSETSEVFENKTGLKLLNWNWKSSWPTNILSVSRNEAYWCKMAPFFGPFSRVGSQDQSESCSVDGTGTANQNQLRTMTSSLGISTANQNQSRTMTSSLGISCFGIPIPDLNITDIIYVEISHATSSSSLGIVACGK